MGELARSNISPIVSPAAWRFMTTKPERSQSSTRRRDDPRHDLKLVVRPLSQPWKRSAKASAEASS